MSSAGRATTVAGSWSAGAGRPPCASAASRSRADYTGITDRPAYQDAQSIAERVAEMYTSRDVDRVVMVYNHFVSALTQRLEVVELLPVPEEAITGEAVRIEGSYIFEPDQPICWRS